MYYNLPRLLLTKLFLASRELKQTIAKIGSIQVQNSLKNPAKKRELKKRRVIHSDDEEGSCSDPKKSETKNERRIFITHQHVSAPSNPSSSVEDSRYINAPDNSSSLTSTPSSSSDRLSNNFSHGHR